MKLLAIIAAYNEADRLGAVLERVGQFVSEVVVVDDGSTDDTAGVARRASATLLRHSVNRGKGAALRTGFTYALQSGADIVITLDADGQHRPEDIPRLLSALQDNESVSGVVGSRAAQQHRMPLFRRCVNQSVSWLLSLLSGQTLHDSQSGFRAYRPHLLDTVPVRNCRFAAESEVLLRASRRGHRFGWVPIDAIYEAGRRSRVRLFRDGLSFLWMLLCVQRETLKRVG